MNRHRRAEDLAEATQQLALRVGFHIHDWCSILWQILGRKDLPQPVSSDLHRRLADFHCNRGELDEARAEATAALRDDKFNIGARVLLDALRDMPNPASRPLAATRRKRRPVRIAGRPG